MRTDLAARYGDERLPRYTSYPTAPHFSAAVGYRDYAAWLEEVEEGLTGSLYLHVPFCRAMCWYCGCNTTVARRDGPVMDFLDLLRREVALVAERLPRRLEVRHVHFGGGTPTILPADAFRNLVDLLRERFALAAEPEKFSRPNKELSISPEKIAGSGEKSIKRLSDQSNERTIDRAID